MKNLIKFFMVMAVLCMTACSHTFEDVSNNAKPQEKTQGRLVMNVGNRSRTIMPIIAADDIKSATLTANNTEIRSWNGDNVIGQIESDNCILLDVGSYNFEMVFCNENSDVILIGTINNQKIKTGNNSLTFDMQISTTGKGNISIELSRGADSGISKIKAGLYNIATGEVVENYEPEELTISSDTYTTCYSKDNVSAGQYIIKFEVYDTSDKLLNTLTDVIEVIGGITTTHQITLDNINTQYYTITYELDGGVWKGFTPITKRNANTKVTLPTADNIEKENFILAGWYDGKGNIITEIPSDTTGDITVTARWGITSEAAISKIKNLSGSETYNIVIGGTITSETISAIKTALKNNSSAKVNLDLSGTTGLNKLPSYAFQECSSLKSVTIPNSVISIGEWAFSYCSSLTSIVIPDSVTSIGDYTFCNCLNLTSVTIPDYITEIASGTFHGCSSLSSVTIPDYITEIASSTFYGCSSLTSVTIPDSVTSIDYYAFNNCSSLTNFNVSENNKNYSTDGKILYNKDKTTLIVYPSATGEVTIPDSVTKIDSFAFWSCSNLTSVTIGNNVTSIGEWAFYYCSNLTSVTIPDSVISIGYAAFCICSNLTNFDVSINNANFSSSEDGKILYNKDKTTLITYPSATGNITILTGVTEIGDYAFESCSDLTNVIIPDSVTEIGDYAFNYCSSLESVVIPDGVISIGSCAFNYCSSLTSVTIPDSVTKIGSYAFYGCSNLTSVTIPDGVTSIDYQAFNGCSSLTTVNYKGTQEQWEQISIGSGNEDLTNATINYNYTE